MSDPDGWRDIDQTQREEIARLRADAEYSFKRISTLEEENRRMREALTPFAEFGKHVDENGWTSNIHRERISDWFGPSDFYRARAALSQEEKP